MTVKGPQNRKRKLSDSALLPQGKQTKFSTPQPQQKKTPQSQKAPKSKNGLGSPQTPQGKKNSQQTPQGKKNTPKEKTPVISKAKQTPKGKSPASAQKSTPKGGTPAKNRKQASAKALAKTLQNDEDDDDDEADEEIVLNLPNDSKSKLFAGQLQESDDDDDDDDEVDEDDDVEEDDDEDDKAIASPPKKKGKMNDDPVVSKQPAATLEGNKKGVKGKNQANLQTKSPQNKTETKSELTDDSNRKNERDNRTLFVKNLPGDCTVKQLKALSKEIKQVRLRAKTSYHKKEKRKQRSGFAFLEFDSEALAEKNMKLLQSSYIEGHSLILDYVGDKSEHSVAKKKVEVGDQDPLKLYVAGLAEDVVESDLRKLFPKASNVILLRRKNDGKLFGYGFIQFSSPQEATQAHDKMQGHKLKGMTLIVLYAKKWKREEKQKQKQQKQAKKAEAKKQVKKETSMAVDAADESDDDDEDDDDEEEESDTDAKVKSGESKKKVLTSQAEEEDDDEEEDDNDEEEDDDDEEEDDDDMDDDDE